MSNDSKNDDFPTIRLDEEDRRDYQQKKHPNEGKAQPRPSASDANTPSAPKKGASGGWLVLIALVALAGCGGCYYLYTQLQQQNVAARQAEDRILQLEKRLSATGEEIGESTVALQVKVSELTDKSNELWEQMDKLWASAWRRNQKEITELGEKLTKTDTTLNAAVNSLKESSQGQQGKLAALNDQISGLADEILSLSVQLEQAVSDKNSQTQQVKNLTDKLSVLENRNNNLASRINELEDEIREIATKVVSQPSSSATPAATPTQ